MPNYESSTSGPNRPSSVGYTQLQGNGPAYASSSTQSTASAYSSQPSVYSSGSSVRTMFQPQRPVYQSSTTQPVSIPCCVIL